MFYFLFKAGACDSLGLVSILGAVEKLRVIVGIFRLKNL